MRRLLLSLTVLICAGCPFVKYTPVYPEMLEVPEFARPVTAMPEFTDEELTEMAPRGIQIIEHAFAVQMIAEKYEAAVKAHNEWVRLWNEEHADDLGDPAGPAWLMLKKAEPNVTTGEP